jgi:hypothetical protein
MFNGRCPPSCFSVLAVAAIVSIAGGFGYSQGGVASALTGVVLDASGSSVPGAHILIENEATHAVFETNTVPNGTFSVPAVPPGSYTVTVTATNFRQAVLKHLEVIAGAPSTARICLELGGRHDVVVVPWESQMVQAQSATVATNLGAAQLLSLPLPTRDVLYSLQMTPGVDTTAYGSRYATIVGLPQATINITLDGVNVQSNYNKTSDGFFNTIQPSFDAVQEVTISTAAPEATDAGQGAVQVRFVTRSGDNNYHGSLYEYHRDTALNANSWFLNRDLTPPPGADPATWKAPRPTLLLNQFGGRLGGPLLLPKALFGPLGFDGHNKAFFFLNYEELHQPDHMTLNRSIFDPAVEQGVFRYGAAGTSQQVGLLALAAANGQVATMDPTIHKLLADIRSSAAKGSVKLGSDPAYQSLTFTDNGGLFSKAPTARFDFNWSRKHHLQVSWNFLKFEYGAGSHVSNPAYPGFPNHDGQSANRFAASATLRSILTPKLVNEARIGFHGGTELYQTNVDRTNFSGPLANQDGFALNLESAGISSAYVANEASRMNSPVVVLEDTLSWAKGAHSLSFGGSLTNIRAWTTFQTVVPQIDFGVDSDYDPAAVMFDAVNGPLNFPGASDAQISTAQAIYALLTGRVTSITAATVLDENTLKYAYNGVQVQRAHQRELGFFAQDSWRVHPRLTLNGGVRWELQLPWAPLNSAFAWATPEQVWGPSGPNLFKPGAAGGVTTEFVRYHAGDPAYHVDFRAIAPNLGLAWNPVSRRSQGWLHTILGSAGQTVFRAGFGVAYNRYGMSDYVSIFGSNPGGAIDASRSMDIGNLVTGAGSDTLPLLLRDKSRLGPPSYPESPAYPLSPTINDSANAFASDMRTPYTISWSVGLQRETVKGTVVEVRYVANRNLQPWFQADLNERNMLGNGFMDEFKVAMANLQANQAAGRGNNFKYYGAGTGTSPLPITLAYFSGLPAVQSSNPASYKSSSFSSSTFVNTLAKTNPKPASYAANLDNVESRRANALAAGLPANFFIVNPAVKNGGAWIYMNGGFNIYDSMVLELRRRVSHGLWVQANYVFAKGLMGRHISYSRPWLKVLGDPLPHTFKISWIYEMPLGHGAGKRNGLGGVLERVIGGWQFNGSARIQSGNLNSVLNARLVGMTYQEFLDSIRLRFDDAKKIAYFLPQDIIDNTVRAFNTSATTSTGYSASFGVPTGRYIAPANSPACIQAVSNDCAPADTYFRGPRFVRFDLSAVKKIKINERAGLEVHGDFFNTFNRANFQFSSLYSLSSPGSAQVGWVYADGQQNDLGARFIQIAIRLNF